MTEEEKFEKDRNREEKERSDREDKARKKITDFMKKAILHLELNKRATLQNDSGMKMLVSSFWTV